MLEQGMSSCFNLTSPSKILLMLFAYGKIFFVAKNVLEATNTRCVCANFYWKLSMCKNLNKYLKGAFSLSVSVLTFCFFSSETLAPLYFKVIEWYHQLSCLAKSGSLGVWVGCALFYKTGGL